MKIDDVRRVLIIGSGTMGLQIGLQCATHGYEVVLYDVDPGALETGSQRIDAFADGLVEAGVIDAVGRERALANISRTTDPAIAAFEADVVSESVPEDPALKGRVLAQFDALCPDRVAALHFHPPVCRRTSSM